MMNIQIRDKKNLRKHLDTQMFRIKSPPYSQNNSRVVSDRGSRSKANRVRNPMGKNITNLT